MKMIWNNSNDLRRGAKEHVSSPEKEQPMHLDTAKTVRVDLGALHEATNGFDETKYLIGSGASCVPSPRVRESPKHATRTGAAVQSAGAVGSSTTLRPPPPRLERRPSATTHEVKERANMTTRRRRRSSRRVWGAGGARRV